MQLLDAALRLHEEQRLQDGLSEQERANEQVEHELVTGEVSDGTLRLLEDARIEVERLAQVLAFRDEYRGAGRAKRLLTSYSPEELAEELEQVLAQWKHHRAESVKPRRRFDPFAGLRAKVNASAERPDYLNPQTDYIGLTLLEQRRRRRIPRIDPISLWTVQPVPDQPWTRLPAPSHGYRSVTMLTDQHDFTYEQACQAARAIILDRMSRADPSTLLLTWIDPSGHGRSAGSFLDLLDNPARLMDQAVWTESGEIAEALQAISDRGSYLEQRCLKHIHPDIDSYNEAAGTDTEPYRIVVVTGFPRAFTDETARRLQYLSEVGPRLGITVLTVTEPALRATFKILTDRGFPFLDSVQSPLPGNSWWHNGLLPAADIVFGHQRRPHAPMRSTRATHPLWVPCDFTTYSDRAAQAIIHGYATASEKVSPIRDTRQSNTQFSTAQLTTRTPDPTPISNDHKPECRLPDGPNSRALLIGTSHYSDDELHDLPAVRNNVIDFAELLVNPQGAGLPQDNCVSLIDADTVLTIAEHIEEQADLADDLLLVYYSGHGLIDDRGELYLAASTTKAPHRRRMSTALPYSLLRSVMTNARARNRVVILDCCFSGLAIESMADHRTLIGTKTDISGTYTLTSSPATDVSNAPLGAIHTAFTGDLINLLRTGSPQAPGLLSLETIYHHLTHSLYSRGLPRPQQRATQLSHLLALTPNRSRPPR